MFKTDKYPRICHFPFSLGATNDDRIVPSGWFEYIKDKPLVFLEKLDGSNLCMNSRGVFGRSHSVVTNNEWDSHMWATYYTIKNDIGDLEIFGENMYAVHSIEYKNLSNYFHVFGVRENGKWFSWEDVKYIGKYFNLNVVPELPNLKFDTEKELEANILSLIKSSAYGDICEGIVMRVSDAFDDNSEQDNFGFNMMKFVRANHVQTDEHWTKHWKKAKLNG